MKRATVAAALATFLLVTGCGGDDDGTDDTGSGGSGTTESTAPDSDEPTEDETSDSGGSGEPTTLLAMVGEEDDPDAFTITLTDESGADVTELTAGDYVVEVIDYSDMHNFHLLGGSVDEATTVDEITEVTWEVTLEAGEYTFICDPHPQNMVGTFEVV